ncbi:MAG: hypothetical protein L3I91_00870 [Mycoplasma sp.]
MIFPTYFAILNNGNHEYNNEEDTGFYHLGLNKRRISVLKLAGGNSQTIYVSNRNLIFNFMPTQFASNNDLSVFNQRALDQQVFNNIIPRYLTNEQFINLSKANENEDLVLNYVNDLYSLIKINHYGLSYNNEANLNNALATYKYTVLRGLLYLYWNQILPEYLSSKKISIEQYLMNHNEGNEKYFNQFFNYRIPSITNPYTKEFVSLNLTGSQFVHMIMIMAGVARFSQTTYYKTPGYSFKGSTYPLNLDGTFLKKIDNRDLSNAFVCLSLDTNSYGIDKIYHYTSHPYLTNTGVSLFWIFISVILFGSSYFKYQRYDIK